MIVVMVKHLPQAAVGVDGVLAIEEVKDRAEDGLRMRRKASRLEAAVKADEDLERLWEVLSSKSWRVGVII
jgi:hypothetical protein